MFENIILEKEQIDLFCGMAEHMKNLPREDRKKFLVAQTFGGATLVTPGYPDKSKRVYLGDLEELARQGLLAQSYGSRGSPAFDITSLGYRYYAYIKQQTGKEDSSERPPETSLPDLNVRVGDSIEVSNSATSKPIFLSYAREDRFGVEEITRKLSQNGFMYWLDKEDLLPGDNWKAKIAEAIENAQYVLVFLSPRSITKTGYFQREVKYILEQRELRPSGQRFIIPILLEPCQPPREFRDIHWLNYWKDGAYEKLKKALTNEASDNLVPISEKESKKLSPNAIVNQIRKVPPYLRTDAGRSYVGLIVDWVLEFAGLLEIQEEKIYGVSAYPENSLSPIYFNADITEYPQLKVMEEGEKIHVVGKIKEIRDSVIYLENCKLIFD